MKDWKAVMQERVDGIVLMRETRVAAKSAQRAEARVCKVMDELLSALVDRVQDETECTSDRLINDSVYIDDHDVSGRQSDIAEAVRRINILDGIEATQSESGGTICVSLKSVKE